MVGLDGERTAAGGGNPCGSGEQAEDAGIAFAGFGEHVGGGLVCQGDALCGFSIAGEDGRFVWAEAIIDGKDVLVSSPEIVAPRSARYGWADNPEVNLYNKDGLPAAPS